MPLRQGSDGRFPFTNINGSSKTHLLECLNEFTICSLSSFEIITWSATCMTLDKQEMDHRPEPKSDLPNMVPEGTMVPAGTFVVPGKEFHYLFV